MNGILAHYRMARHHTIGNQMVCYIEGSKTRDAAGKFIGKKVIYHTGTKEISGEITAAHGNSGAVRVHFETGMPGQAIGKTVSIN